MATPTPAHNPPVAEHYAGLAVLTIGMASSISGGMAEWTNATVLKTVMRLSASWVRIPLPPPIYSGARIFIPGSPSQHSGYRQPR